MVGTVGHWEYPTGLGTGLGTVGYWESSIGPPRAAEQYVV